MSRTLRTNLVAVAAALLAAVVLTGLGATTRAAAAPELSAAPTGDIGCAINPLCSGPKIIDKGKNVACSAPMVGTVCDEVATTAKGVGDTLSGPLNGLKNSVDALTSAVNAIGSFNPKDLPETWAKAALHGVVWMLGKVQTLAAKFSTPGYASAWWGRQYAVTYGLALVVLPFMLLYVGARIGGRDGPVSGVTLARDVVARLPWTVPAIVLAPALMIVTQGLLAQLAKGFGEAGTAQAGSAADAFMREIANAPHGNGFFAALGGAFMALVLLVVAILFGIPVLLELAFANWGANFFGLLVPLAIVFAIYPPWRKVLSGLIAFLVGIWLIPFAVNFVFWSVWAAAGNVTRGDTFGTLLYVIVGLMMLAVVPALAPAVLMKLMPEYHGPVSGGADGGSAQNRTRNQSERSRELSRRRSPEHHDASQSESATSSSTQSGQPAQPANSGSPEVTAVKPVHPKAGEPPADGASTGSSGTPGTSGSPTSPGGAPQSGGSPSAGAGAGGGAGALAGSAAGATMGVAGVAAAAIAKKMKSETYRARNKWTRH